MSAHHGYYNCLIERRGGSSYSCLARISAIALAGVALSLLPLASANAQQAGGGEINLDEVRVEGQARDNRVPPAYAGGQVATGARLGALGNTDTKNSPFSIVSYTDQFARDRQASTVSEALVLEPSVRATQGTGAPFDSYYIRGFPINEGTSGEIAFDGVFGVAPSLRIFTDYVERIEVLKGPSGALMGMSPNGGVGGVINIVPKSAHEDLTRLTLDYSSTAHLGGQVDFARRFGDNKEWGARIIGGLYGGDTAIDHQSERSSVGAVALDYQGERFRAWLYLLAQKDHFDAPLRPFFMTAGVPVPGAPSGRTNVTQPWEYSDVNDQGGLLRAEYDLNDNVTAFGAFGASRTEVERYFASAVVIKDVFGNTTTTPQFYDLAVDRYTVEGGLRANFDTGPVHHNVTLLGSYYDEETFRALGAGRGSYTSNIYNPVSAPYIAPIIPGSRPRLSASTLSGVTIADTLSVLDERILLTLGVRQQNIKASNYVSNVGTLTSSYDKSATTPVFGLVLKPWENISVYGNYIEGLSRGDVAPALATNSGEVLAPYIAKQLEAGVKFDFGQLGGSISAFQITKPVGELNSALYYSESGEQRVRGLEFSAYGKITPEVRILGGFTLLDGQLTETATLANIGNTPIGVPRVQLNLGAEWDLPWVPGLTLDGAIIYTGKQYVNVANTQELPDWTRFDLGFRYASEVYGKKTTLRANVVNLADTNYWAGVASYGTFTQGTPRTFLLSLSVDL